MIIKASGRSALIMATGLFVYFTGPSPIMAAGADDTTAMKLESATAGKAVKQASPQAKRHASRKSDKVPAKSAEAGKTADSDVADAAGGTPATIPASVANANAQLTPADSPADSASAMSAKASTMLVAATDKPADGQAATDAEVVASDQLNDVDRALQQTPQPPPAQTVAMAQPKAAPAAPVQTYGNDNSTWDQTSLIGKVFIAFGALLTMASAARMFMA